MYIAIQSVVHMILSLSYKYNILFSLYLAAHLEVRLCYIVPCHVLLLHQVSISCRQI